MRPSRTIWAGCTLALGLALGCRHTQPQPEGCTTCGNPPPAVTTAPAPQRLTLVPTPPPLVPTTPSLVPSDMPVVTIPPRPVAAAPRTMPPVTAAPVAPDRATVAVNPEQSAPPPAPAAEAPKRILTERGAAPPPSAWVMPQSKAPEVVQAPAHTPAPTAVSTANAPPYYNSQDYSILFGVLDYSARRGTWRLRYADAGDEDRYGGCVTLDGVGRQMQDYVSGQAVRVEGGLVDPESRDVSPAYRVKEMRPVTPGK